MATNSQDWWARLEFEFRDLADTVRTLHYEPQAKNLTRKEWDKYREAEEVGSLMRFRPTDDRDELEAYRDDVLQLITELEPMFAMRELTAAFTQRWGAFNFGCGVLLSSIYAGQENLDGRRAAKLGGDAVKKTSQKVWVAHQLSRALEADRRRAEAELNLGRAIKKLLESATLPDGFEREWLRSLLQDGQLVLKTSYLKKYLSDDEVRKIAATEQTDIPLLEF